MAHIADFMVEGTSSVGLNNYIARELSPHSVQDVSHTQTIQETPKVTPRGTPTEEKEKFVWRMHQPVESSPRKYQLFPAKEKLSITAGRKSPDQEPAGQQVVQNGASEKALTLPALRLKPKEQTITRRRKVSIPELGPMTTVQEVAMDSPTIPGRPPMHERSTSAPGNSWRRHPFGESMLSCIHGPAFDEAAEILAMLDETTQETTTLPGKAGTGSSSPKRPLSPRTLAPLLIPTTSANQKIPNPPSTFRMRTGSAPPDVPPKSARMDVSPHTRGSPYTPYTPYSASSLSASTAPTSISSTPLSAQPFTVPEGRASPKPWSAGPKSATHTRGQSEITPQRSGSSMGHRRGESETSILDRGRPKKRTEGSPMKHKPSGPTAAAIEEHKVFEALPQGYRVQDACSQLPGDEIEALRKQALGQASRFEVLSSKDVDALSRELRGLDERCDYLRKTHRSLRAGRRNLHDRICNYLRSPRVAQFSHHSILKQEEALAELDSSIDDWVSKLELAENRRTRIRQKLLEHVAGALIIPQSRPQEMTDTPPRSPIKSHSPPRLAAPVKISSPEPMGRPSAESIRIYADNNISALLKDVEEEISRMGEQADIFRVQSTVPTTTTNNNTTTTTTTTTREVNKAPAMFAGITLSNMTFNPYASS